MGWQMAPILFNTLIFQSKFVTAHSSPSREDKEISCRSLACVLDLSDQFLIYQIIVFKNIQTQRISPKKLPYVKFLIKYRCVLTEFVDI